MFDISFKSSFLVSPKFLCHFIKYFVKHFQGATIKTDEETGKIIIARIMHGGAADRSGLIHVVSFEVLALIDYF